jgi:5'-nucleotidase
MIEEEEGPAPPLDFGRAAAFAVELARWLGTNRLPDHTLLNVNVPANEPRGVELTRQGVRRYPGKLEKRTDPMGRAYYWIGGDEPVDVREAGTDVHAIAEDRISVTPIQLDLTDHGLLERVRAAAFPGVQG